MCPIQEAGGMLDRKYYSIVVLLKEVARSRVRGGMLIRCKQHLHHSAWSRCKAMHDACYGWHSDVYFVASHARKCSEITCCSCMFSHINWLQCQWCRVCGANSQHSIKSFFYVVRKFTFNSLEGRLESCCSMKWYGLRFPIVFCLLSLTCESHTCYRLSGYSFCRNGMLKVVIR